MTSGRSQLVDVLGTFRHATCDALMIDFGDEDGKSTWLPKSQVQLDVDDPLPGQHMTVTMPEWLALEKGLI